METKSTLTDVTFRKIPYILLMCLDILFIILSRNILIKLLNSISYETFADFTLNYMKSDSHQVIFILALILLIISTMIFSIYLLSRDFEYQEKIDKILNIILIIADIGIVITVILVNIIIFKLVFMMILVSFGIAFMFSGIGQTKND